MYVHTGLFFPVIHKDNFTVIVKIARLCRKERRGPYYIDES